jgi:MoaA/NifB/PqqE/SkfB family radical SAM enzyme
MSTVDETFGSSLSKTFCIYPWEHLATLTNGDVIPCCIAENLETASLHKNNLGEIWNGDWMKSIRRKMMKGEEVDSCRRCYEDEKSGLDSYRISSLRYAKSCNKDFHHILSKTRVDGTVDSGPLSLDLRLGNVCNLKCIMCRPQESVKWVSDAFELKTVFTDSNLKKEMTWKSRFASADFSWYKDGKFWDDFYQLIPSINEIVIGGGEPFFIPEVISFIEESVKRGLASRLKIRFHTNGTHLPENLVKLFDCFREVQVVVSIDGVGDKNAYMRFPANWSSIERNLKTLDLSPSNVHVFILTSIHAVSFFYVNELVDWKIEKRFKKISNHLNLDTVFTTGIVREPAYLNTQIYPKALKREVQSRINLLIEKLSDREGKERKTHLPLADRFKGLIQHMEASDESHLWPRFKDYINGLDKVRNTEFSKVFPELYFWLEQL